jgi:hypothetical protein
VQLFLPRYGQPDADALHNLSTAIKVDQQPLGGNPRSTLGTATEVYTMFRVLFARIVRSASKEAGSADRRGCGPRLLLSLDMALGYDTVRTVAREEPRTAMAAVRATGYHAASLQSPRSSRSAQH